LWNKFFYLEINLGLIWEIFAIISENEEVNNNALNRENSNMSEASQNLPVFLDDDIIQEKDINMVESENLAKVTEKQMGAESNAEMDLKSVISSKKFSQKLKKKKRKKSNKAPDGSLDIDDVEELNFTSDEFFSEKEVIVKSNILEKGNSNTTDEVGRKSFSK
jgi:hypothetical protein